MFRLTVISETSLSKQLVALVLTSDSKQRR